MNTFCALNSFPNVSFLMLLRQIFYFKKFSSTLHSLGPQVFKEIVIPLFQMAMQCKMRDHELNEQGNPIKWTGPMEVTGKCVSLNIRIIKCICIKKTHSLI